MIVFGKPANNWGWARIAGLVILAGVLLWTLLAVLLRALGGVPALAWTGYPTLSLARGLELSVAPLLLALIAGWLEDQAVKAAVEHSAHQQAAQAAAAQQKAILKHIHEATLAAIAAEHQQAVVDLPQVRSSLIATVRESLPILNGKGRGEVLHFFYEHGLLSAGKTPLDLTGLDFSGLDLHKAHLPNIHLDGVDLRQAKLEGAHLRQSTISGADLTRAILRHADLREAVLSGCNLTRANLEGANLEGADLTRASLKNTYFKHASLQRCVVSQIEMAETVPGSAAGSLGALDQAILIDTILPDGRKVTNAKGREFLQKKEMEEVINRL